MTFVRSAEIAVDVPPDRVYALLSDIRRHPEWAGNRLKVQHIDGPETGPGAHYASMVNDPVPGSIKPVAGDITIVTSHAPELFVYECTDDGGGSYRWMFEVSVWNEITMVGHTVDRLVGPRRVRLFQPLMWRFFGRKQVEKGLSKLQLLAERSAPPTPSQRQPIDP